MQTIDTVGHIHITSNLQSSSTKRKLHVCKIYIYIVKNYLDYRVTKNVD